MSQGLMAHEVAEGVRVYCDGLEEPGQLRFLGTITEVNWTAFKIKWDDGIVSMYRKGDCPLPSVHLEGEGQ